MPTLEEELVAEKFCGKQVRTGAVRAVVLMSLVTLKLETTGRTYSYLQHRNQVMEVEAGTDPPACVCGSAPGGWSTGSLRQETQV